MQPENSGSVGSRYERSFRITADEIEFCWVIIESWRFLSRRVPLKKITTEPCEYIALRSPLYPHTLHIGALRQSWREKRQPSSRSPKTGEHLTRKPFIFTFGFPAGGQIRNLIGVVDRVGPYMSLSRRQPRVKLAPLRDVEDVNKSGCPGTIERNDAIRGGIQKTGTAARKAVSPLRGKLSLLAERLIWFEIVS